MRISDWSSDVCSSDLVDLGLGQRHESPIVRPGIVEDRENDRGLALELRFVDLADDDAIVALARLDDALDDRRKFLGDVEIVGQQFLDGRERSEEHTSELQSLMRISYAVFCLKTKKSRLKNHN